MRGQSATVTDCAIELKWLEECPSEVWEHIFSFLRDADSKTLLACRATCVDFQYWVDQKTSLWSRVRLTQERSIYIFGVTPNFVRKI